MARSHEEVVAALKQIAGGQYHAEIGLGFDRAGHPNVYFADCGGQYRYLNRSEIERSIQFLSCFLEICPDDATISHENLHFCGDLKCEICYQRERGYGRGGYDDPLLMLEPRDGYVVMYEVNGKLGFFASSRPERRLKEIERQLSESVRYIHKVATNDQIFLKHLWTQNMVDFQSPRGTMYELSARAQNLFKLKERHEVSRQGSWAENMGEIDLADIANFPHLRKVQRRNYWDGQE